MANDTAWEFLTRDATAFNELQVLRQAGAEGWELIDLGAFKLHFRRPRDAAQVVRWDYARHTGLLGDRVRQQMRERGWDPAGRWVFFHYFKRPRR